MPTNWTVKCESGLPVTVVQSIEHFSFARGVAQHPIVSGN